MKKVLFFFVLLAFMTTNAYSQKFAVKSNLLYDLTTTINLGVEFGLADKWTLDISGNYNPWKFSDDCDAMRLKHWLVQPELRYWTCEKFNGHFFGLHGHYGDYNVGGIKFLSENMEKHRYQGTLYGAGLSYGYQWLLSNRWSMEAVIGAGWAHMDHDKFDCACCGDMTPKDRDYFGVTKVALSIIYFIK
ncbi:hypothetical protein M2480_003116 [Parabacteroides sp. PFB2-12]|uniref:DUF3575 domain-containing protein n=1 Tax=unclassified Parabacteroides TaxID=2649774 RepID=UPI002477017C|nr:MULTISPECIES: DUF3575 domain-containing protein [unclassified Parabacteroides]MDH6344201.1 hypothetical protein [Parabacteroides sp. PM6-13]MDH6392108.1 hypothetical protein [Parabacteroides sp. PFB2-12]